MVFENFWVAAPSLQPLFQEFQQISALQLNVCKTVMIPLWSFNSKDNVVKLVREFCPGWAKFEVASCGKYLGYLIGPGAGAGVWSKALAKFKCRVTFWASLHLGIPFNVVAFNVFIVPVLEFIAQLCDVDKDVSDAMDWAMRQLAAGPGTWATRRDLENLTSYGFKDEFRTIENTARAAKMRIVATVAKDVFNRNEEILLSQAESLNRPFRSWHASSFFGILKRNRDELARVGITEERILRKCTEIGCTKKCDRSFQYVARSMIKSRLEPYNVEHRIRHKIRRSSLLGPSAHVASRIVCNILVAGRSGRPCVTSMVFRTLWNGWPTTARMRTCVGAGPAQSCIFGCQYGEDRLEHFLMCPVVWRALTANGWDASQRTKETMLIARRGMATHEINQIAIALYVVARSVHSSKQHGCPDNLANLFKLFMQDVQRVDR